MADDSDSDLSRPTSSSSKLVLTDTRDRKQHKANLPIRMPCGIIIPNKFVKVALYEHLTNLQGGPPNSLHYQLYSRWSAGGWGMIITGNVQVSQQHLTLGRDMVIPSSLTESSIAPFRQLASIIHREQNLNEEDNRATKAGSRSFVLLVQVKLMFQTPKAAGEKDIDEIVNQFVRGAELAVRSGFDGIEVHASHGYLLAQFVMPKANRRKDSYSAISDPLHLLRRVITSIRNSKAVPSNFAIGIKLNAADYISQDSNSNTSDSERALSHVIEIAQWDQVDFLEISGGDYENPDFLNGSQQSSPRQALFSQFSQRAMEVLESLPNPPSRGRPLVLLTGGLRTPSIISSVLQNNHADLLGVGRSSVLYPDLPHQYLANPDATHFPVHSEQSGKTHIGRVETTLISIVQSLWDYLPTRIRPSFPKLIGAGTEMSWYVVKMRELARERRGIDVVGFEPGLESIVRMWWYLAPSEDRTVGSVWWTWGGIIGIVVAIICMTWR
ncbi:Aldolase-type TIM barrel [Abortiporus biennis]